MTFGNNLLFFFSALGAFNGILAGLYFIFFTAKKNLSNYLLGALLIALSIRIGKSVFYFFDRSLPVPVLQVGLTACLFIGPLLYFFVRTEMMQIRKMPAAWSKQFIAWALVIIVVGLIWPYQHFPELWKNYIIPLIYFQWGVYIAFTAALVTPLLKRIGRGEKLKPFEKWLLAIGASTTAIFIAYVSAIARIAKGMYIAGPLCFSLITYLTIFILLQRKKANDLSAFSGQKYGDKKLDAEEVGLIIARLREVMTAKELFRNPGLKVGDLARAVNISGHQLSRILNENLQKNFTQFVNEYRINAACEMLSGPTHFTIEGIGDEVGFNSKSTFFTAFKKIKGLTPNAYLQQTSPDS